MLLDIQQNFISLLIVLSFGFSIYCYATIRHSLTLPFYLIPQIGLGLLSCTITALWFCKVSMIYAYVIVLSIDLSLFLFLLFCYKKQILKPIFLNKGYLGCVALVICLLVIQSAAVPFSSKISQGFPWDRYTYIGAAVGFTQHDLKFYQDQIRTLESDGSNKQFWLDHINGPMISNDMHKRPTVDLLIGVLNFNNKNQLHYLGHSFETLLRIMQFFSFLYLCSLLVKNKYIAVVITGSFAFGYWFQYIKDFNAWGFQFATIFSVASLATIVDLLKTPEKPLGRTICLGLFIATACIGYPESGIILSLILLSSLAAIYLLHKSTKKTILISIIAITIGLLVSFLIYPYELSYIKWLFGRLNDTDFSECERYIRSLLNPYIWSQTERYDFIKNGVTPLTKHISSLYPSIVLGIMGLHYVMKAKLIVYFSVATAALLSIFYCIYRTRKNLANPKNLIITLYCGLWILEIIAYLSINQRFPALRSVSYIFPLISFLVIILYINSNIRIIQFIAYAILLFNLVYGSLVFKAQRNINYHNFDNEGYALTHDGVRLEPFNNNGKLNDIYNLDYSGLESDVIKKCNFVYLDLDNYWTLAGVVFMLESNNIRYETRLPYRDFLFGGGVKSPGRNINKFSGNCIIAEKSAGVKIVLTLTIIEAK